MEKQLESSEEIENAAIRIININGAILQINKPIEIIAETIGLIRKFYQQKSAGGEEAKRDADKTRCEINHRTLSTVMGVRMLHRRIRGMKNSKRIQEAETQNINGPHNLRETFTQHTIDESLKKGLKAKLELELESRGETRKIIEQIKSEIGSKLPLTIEILEKKGEGRTKLNEIEEYYLKKLICNFERNKEALAKKYPQIQGIERYRIFEEETDVSIALSALLIMNQEDQSDV